MEHIGDILERSKLVPIKTVWNGIEFRSRLEARWAVFLTELGIEWLYEFEGFELPSGRYLPDFWLPKIQDGTWLEIKPDGYFDGHSKERCFVELCEASKKNVAVAMGLPNEGVGIYYWKFSDGCAWCDFEYSFCECPKCGRFGIEFGARGHRVCGTRCFPPEKDRGWGITPRIEQAIQAAKVARFW